MITDQQVRQLRKFYQASGRVSVAAARAGMSEPSARKFLRTETLPSEHQLGSRDWRTHGDAFEDVWLEVEELLKQNPGLQAVTIFGHLQRADPGKYQDGQLRTLQRRIKVWRATAGPAREVFFAQKHEPGQLCQSDFTHMSKLGVTIGGQQFEHLIYHFVLSYSNWETGTVCFSESFESLSEGLQNALWELGGVPKAHRTDRLTTAVHKVDHPEEFTQRYQGVLRHYGLEGRKIQARQPHENGDVEQSHYRFKQALDQVLMLRGNRDFRDRSAYVQFLRDLFKQRNAGRRDRLAEELAVLRFLPGRRLETRQKLRVRVGPGSTIRVAKNTYSVHSRLRGEQVVVILGAEDLEIWYGQRKVDRLLRLRGEGKHRIEYRHIIDALLRKPGAFENYRYREDLFPSSNFRMAYDNLVHARPGQAAKEYLGILELAAKEGEARVERILRQRSADGLLIRAEELERALREETLVARASDVCIMAMNLGDYDELLSEEATTCLATLH
jgi:hypothetical protein